MNEITIPAIIPAAVAGNLTNLISERAHFEPERVLVSRPMGDRWQAVTAKEYEEEIKAVAKGFIAAGVNFGDRVAIMAKTRYEWTVLDFAIWYAGAVPVPIYETSSAEQVDWILTDSGAVAIVVETPALAELVQPVMPATCKKIWNITYNALATLTHEGKGVSDDEITKRREKLKPETLATLIYTSGTTGKPKGVQLTHGNFLSECGNVVNGASDLFLKPGGSTLLFLPVAHVFGRMVQIGSITAGLHLAHCSDLTKLPADLASFKPTFVLAVPRIFEKSTTVLKLRQMLLERERFSIKQLRLQLHIARHSIPKRFHHFLNYNMAYLINWFTPRFALVWAAGWRQQFQEELR